MVENSLLRQTGYCSTQHIINILSYYYIYILNNKSETKLSSHHKQFKMGRQNGYNYNN